MSPGLRITAIVAAYNEADIIGQTVGNLVRQHIHVHVLDNLSTDGTVAALQPYAASGLVHVERFPAGNPAPGDTTQYQHARIMQRKQQLARELDSDWFIAHDADEIRESPWTHVSLREGIERVDRGGWNAIDFAVLNFCPTNDRFDPDVDIRETFRYFEVGGPWDRAQVKCWKKAPDIELVASAGHDAQFASRRVFPIRFILRHYPVRGQAHGMRKVFEERKSRFLQEERDRGWHVQYDAISTGHQFLRNPTTLSEFDPEKVRLESLIHDAGELQTALEEQQQRSAELQHQIDLQAAPALRQERQITRQEEQIVRQDEQIKSQMALIETQAKQIESQATNTARLSKSLAERDSAIAQLQVNNDRLERALADLHRSHSWRLTTPLRAIWRLFQGS